MKRIFSISFLTAILTIALLSCQNGTPGNDPDNPDNPGNPSNPDNPAVVMQNVALSGTVKDTNGNPLSGVKVTTGSLNATTGADGTFSFKQAGTVDDRVILKLEKSGYFTLTRSCEKDSSLYVEAMLYPQGNSAISLQTTFDASTAKTLQVGGATIDFPASSIVSADGKAYSGTVHADVLYLAPDNANITGMMPGGDWMGRASDNSKGILLPGGMVNVLLTDNSGNRLNINDKSGVVISFPAPTPASGAQLPATVSLYTFDEAKGLWTEDGSLTLQGNVYTGTVSHFCWYTEEWGPLTTDLRLIDISAYACSEPAEYAEILISMLPTDALESLAWDDAGRVYCDEITETGYYRVELPASPEWKATITVKYKGKSQSKDIPDLSKLDNNASFNFNFNDDCPGGITFNLLPGSSKDQFIVQCVPAMPQPQFGSRSTPDLFLIHNGLSDEGAFSWTTLGGSQDQKTGLYLGSHNFVYAECGWNKDFTEYTYTIISNMWGGAPDWIGTVYMNEVDTELYNTETLNGDLKWLNIKSISIGNNTPVAMEVHRGYGE